jgi:hypothetical protein
MRLSAGQITQCVNKLAKAISCAIWVYSFLEIA